MIPKKQLGRTGHASTRTIFGGWALSRATQAEADRVLATLLKYGVNHIDTAPMYGNAEKLIGTWMKQHRKDFFLATKTRKRTYKEALEGLKQSMSRLQVDHIDLWQMHSLTNQAGWEKAMGSGGALEALVDARNKGLVRFLGVTGHGNNVPAMHIRSLQRFDFDSVLLPYNYPLMQVPRYTADFDELTEMCLERNVAVQTMKSIARWPCGGRSKTHNTYFYEPLETQEAIDKAVHWSLGLQESFMITAGDVQLLPKVLDAAQRYEKRPSDTEMNALASEFDMQPVFSHAAKRGRGSGPQTWGGQMSRALGELVHENFFKHPNGKTLDQVIRALESKGLSIEGRRGNISNSIDGRVKKGVLKRCRVADGWAYWTE